MEFLDTVEFIFANILAPSRFLPIVHRCTIASDMYITVFKWNTGAIFTGALYGWWWKQLYIDIAPFVPKDMKELYKGLKTYKQLSPPFGIPATCGPKCFNNYITMHSHMIQWFRPRHKGYVLLLQLCPESRFLSATKVSSLAHVKRPLAELYVLRRT